MKTLFLKYRPQDFESIVGQQHVVRTLQNSVKQDRVSHAYLFAGSRGTGKTSTARILAKALNAGVKDGDIDLGHPLAQMIADGNCVDVIEIDAASNRGIDEIRDLREKVLYAPSMAPKKVYIIDEVHMLTKEAFNALLKTLEEPPEHVHFVLATTELHKIPETILSRCQVFYFQRITEADIMGRLRYIAGEEKIEINDEALALVAKKAEGGLRDSISYLEQLSAEYDEMIDAEKVRAALGMVSNEVMQDLWACMQADDCAGALGIVREYAVQGGDFRAFGHDFLRFLQTLLHAAVAQKTQTHLIVRCIDEFHEALGKLKTSPLPSLPFEVALVRLQQGPGPVAAPRAVVSRPAPVARAAAPAAVAVPVPRATPAVARKVEPKASVPKNGGFVFDDAPLKPVENVAKVAPGAVVGGGNVEETGGSFGATQTKVASSLREMADRADLPSYAKRSLLTTKPKLVGGTIVFVVDSEFHHGKLDKPEIVEALRVVAGELFGEVPLVRFEVKTNNSAVSLDDFSF